MCRVELLRDSHCQESGPGLAVLRHLRKVDEFVEFDVFFDELCTYQVEQKKPVSTRFTIALKKGQVE